MRKYCPALSWSSVGLLCCLASAQEESTSWSLGDPPRAPTAEEVLELKRRSPVLLSRTGPFVVNTANREEVRLFHQTVYSESDGIASGWTGDVAACLAGATAPDFQDAVARRINYFRALAGVPAGIGFDDLNNAKDQEAALMMSANDALSHSPPLSWSCYTEDGAEAAGKSNIAIGRRGPDAIDGYMEDFGGNNTAVGHRRWLLYPQTQTMGTGDVEADGVRRAANAVWVFDGNYGGTRPVTRTDHVSWPPAGYVPYQVVYPRWSFSYPNANFSGATVTMSNNGEAMSVTVESISGNIGENTLVWYPSGLNPGSPYAWPRPTEDTAYDVTVQNVMIGGVPEDFSYQVIVFDPSVTDSQTVLSEITGPDQPAVGLQNEYSFTPVPSATAHQYRASRRFPFTLVDGAENGLDMFTANTSPGYEVIVSSPKASGSHAYHLAHTVLAPQALTYHPILVPGTGAELRFQSRLGYATSVQVARAQVLVGGSGVWQDVYVQPGSDSRGETSFNLRTVSLSAYVGRSIQVRFLYDESGGSFYSGADSGVGWYIDDVAITQSEELQDSSLSAPLTGSTFTWSPPQEGEFALEVRAEVFGHFHADWGLVKAVNAAAGALPPVLRFIGMPIIAAGQIEIEFEVENLQPNPSFELLRSSVPNANWEVDDSATFETGTNDSIFRVRATVDELVKGDYFRLRAN